MDVVNHTNFSEQFYITLNEFKFRLQYIFLKALKSNIDRR